MSVSMAATQQGAIDPTTILSEVEALGARIGRVRAAIGRVIFGQDEVVDQTLITLLSGGHALLVGVPGLGKSRLVETLGVVLGLATKRGEMTWEMRSDWERELRRMQRDGDIQKSRSHSRARGREIERG